MTISTPAYLVTIWKVPDALSMILPFVSSSSLSRRDHWPQHAGAAGTSQRIERVLLMAEPPSIDANEIADKGYVNQAATRARRAALVEELYHKPPAVHIACARPPST